MKIERLEFELPQGYRADDILNFYNRDPEGISEIVEGCCLRKGLIWEGQACCFRVGFAGALAEVRLECDGFGVTDLSGLKAMAGRCLGLDQEGEAFEKAVESDTVLGPVVLAQRGRRVPVTATPFEALAWAIIGQQISVTAAVSIRRRLLQALNLRHSGGLLCFPTALQLGAMDIEDLVAVGFSRGKAGALKAVCVGVADGSLPLDEWLLDRPVSLIRERLLAVRGIGPWTVDYTLLRGFGWLDGSLHGDVAVRRNLARMLGLAEYPSQEFTRLWLEKYAPWRALAAAHLWGAKEGL
jgi:DNA-3-methyladenine glycosylase II